jgi:DNA polymerase II large subunit
VLNDGVIGRAAKVSTIVKKLGIEGWDWLQKLGDTEGSRESENKAGFMEDIIAGRPIFSFPSERGGFRLRYGRARNTGLAAVGIHPLTMTVLDRFLAGGTQIRIEFPGKGGVVMPVDTIEPPVVLLKNGSVARVTDQNIHDIKDQIAKILFLGDLLISFGDFLYNNKELRPSGYTEDWWCTELKLRIAECFESNMEEAAKHLKMPKKRLETILANPYTCKPKAAEAVTIAKLLSVPLHPHCTFFWTHITTQELQEMRQWILKRRGVKEDNGQASRIRFDENARVKSILERLCLPHRVEDGKIIIDGEPAHAVFASLGLGLQDRHVDASLSSLDALNTLSDVTIRAKAPTILGARMGRPEKAKRRDMKPRVHLLFPVGLAGGSQRDLISASQKGPIRVELARRRCLKCGKPASGARCQLCSNETAFEKYCPLCGKKVEVDVCPSCKAPTKCFTPQTIDLKAEIRKAGQALEMRPPRKVKGVKGLTNETLKKGFCDRKKISQCTRTVQSASTLQTRL